MGSAFTKIEEDQDAYIYRSKVQLILENYHRFGSYIKSQLRDYKYVLAVDVDPPVDPIEKESMEKRLNGELRVVKDHMQLLHDRMNRISLNQDSLYDSLCQDKNVQRIIIKQSDD